MQVVTKNKLVYEALRDDIVEGNLRPGERLVISDLAAKYEVSPMPVRESINRLQQDGFVEVIPHIGARVKEMNLNDFREMLLIREELEPLACRLSVRFMDEKVLATCDAIIAEMESCLQASDFRRFGKLNKELHMTIYCASPYHILQDMIRNLWDRSEYTRNVFKINSRRNKDSHAEHIEWVQALRNGDEERAVEILRSQKRNQFGEYLRTIEERDR